jgi:hypothetical protein
VTLTWDAMFDLDDHPERKIELIDGRLVIGNSLRGSSFVLWDLLASFSPDAVGVFSGNDSRDALESASSTPSTSRRKSSPSSKRRPSTSEHSSRSRLKAIRPVVDEPPSGAAARFARDAPGQVPWRTSSRPEKVSGPRRETPAGSQNVLPDSRGRGAPLAPLPPGIPNGGAGLVSLFCQLTE